MSIQEGSMQITVSGKKKDDYETAALKEGDVVEFLYFMGGGC